MKWPFVLRLLFFLSCSVVWSQTAHPSFLNFSDKEGLPDKNCYAVIQDPSGTIWVGAASGLYRLTGKSFQKINSTADRPGHQISNVLQAVYWDAYRKKIWLASLNSLQTFDPKTGVFQAMNLKNKGIEQALKSTIAGFYRDSKHRLWAWTMDRFWFQINDTAQTATAMTPPFPTREKTITRIFESPGKLWACSTDGLYEFGSGTITKVGSHPNSTQESLSFLDGYYDAKRQCLWLAAGYQGVVTYDLNQQAFQFFPLKEAQTKNASPYFFVSLVEPRNAHSIWFAASGLGVFDCNQHTFSLIPTEVNSAFGFKTQPIARFMTDREQNLWMASYNGVGVHFPKNSQLQTLPLLNPKAGYIIEPYSTLEGPNGLGLIANNTSNGLLVWNRKTQQLSVWEHPNYKGKPRVLSGVSSLVKTPDGRYYGLSGEDVFQLDFTQQKLVPVSFTKGKIPQGVLRMLADAQGNVYMATASQGLWFWERKQNVVKSAAAQPRNSIPSISPRIVDHSGKVWFTQTEGVYYREANQGRFVLVNRKAANNGVKITQSIDIVETQPNVYWVSTNDNGIFELDLRQKTPILNNYNTSNSGLPSDFCSRLIYDQRGYLWVGTLRGLVRFDTQHKRVLSVYTPQNGMWDNNVTVNLNLHSDGSLIVNHYGALTIVPTKALEYATLAPKTTILEMQVMNRLVPLQSSLTLQPHETVGTFVWASSVTTNLNQQQYAYRLEGLDKEWHYTTDNSITYTGLASGEYTFKVRSASADGVWGVPTQVTLTVLPPFYQTIGFYVVILVLIGLLLYWFYRMKVRQIRKESQLKSDFAKQLAAMEMKALRAQMNPHFIFNSLNSIQKYILKNDDFAASQYLTKFSKLIRLILDHSNQHYIPLSSELELLRLYIEIEFLRFEDQFTYQIEVDPSLQPELLRIPSMIIQPYIENAIWHGLLHKDSPGTLRLMVMQEGNQLKVIVEDDGIGRAKAQALKSKQVLKKKSYGLQITSNRIDLINQTQSQKTTLQIDDLHDASGVPSGTRVTLFIPIATNFEAYDSSRID